MADALDFCNPFWEKPKFKKTTLAMSSRISDLASIGIAALAIDGKGTIAVKSWSTDSVEFRVKQTGDTPYPILVLKITNSTVSFSQEDKDGNATPLIDESVRPEGNPYVPTIAPKDGTVYWLSVDRSNRVLRYGKHYTCKALTLMEVKLDSQLDLWLEHLGPVEVDDGASPQVKISRLPVIVDLPPTVVTNEEVSLRDLSLRRVTTWANLPEACQKLYHNVAGKNVTLESPDFEGFADAIHKSVTTEGYWGHSKLKSKCKDPNNVEIDEFRHKYLRITIGSHTGNSPGIPYVMEVWPPRHRSPIHDHGNACAVIRILSGAIQCTWYDAVIGGAEPTKLGEPVVLKKDKITWIGDNQYQVHALENTKEETCVTLQCYAFTDDNNLHVEKFQYIDAKSKDKAPFTPNSDCTFEDFYTYMKWEWDNKGPYPTGP
ncbi:hypothetical protein TWF506_002646 [Arthrobotrys conoides]|uniref:cysteine dioxygenase n=1 Tax=Arthrobotrys conoides TaxID=74498 RepID=A0AAN8N8N2_9PEZI